MSTELLAKKLFTIDDFTQMEEMGILPRESRYELIRGEIVTMPAHSYTHEGRVNKLNRIFTSRLGETVVVSVQNSLAIRDVLPMSRPKPDIQILKPLEEFFGPFCPLPDEVLLLIEVSDTSLAVDRKVKVPLYAEARVHEYWILNINEQVLEVRTMPENGEYRRVEYLRCGETVSPLLLPELTLKVDDLLL